MVALLTRTLGVVCPSCDFLNVIGAVRCMACGSATDGTGVPASSPSGLSQAPVSAAVGAQPTTAPARPPPPPPPPEPAPNREPPGLRRSSPTPPPIEALGEQPSPPSGPHRGPPARPTFQSSASSSTIPSGPKFGLTVLAGPARGQRFKLAAAGAQIGRSRGAILFPEDPFVSALHATLLVREGKLVIRDEASTSGVLVSVSGTETIGPGSCFATGLRMFRYIGQIEPQPAWNRVDVLVYGAPLPNNQVHYAIEEVLLGERPGRCVITPGPVLTIGQGRCEFSYPNDEGLAPRHCEVAPLPTGAMIRDLSGGLCTFVRVQGERTLKAGDRLRIGQQTLQVEVLS